MSAIGTLIYLFFFFIFFMIFFQVISDLFRDHEMSGGTKLIWILFLVILPPLAVLIYLILRGGGMAKRNIAAQQAMQKQMDDYVRQTAGTGSATEQIEKAKSLLDSGAIDQSEYDALKKKALSS